MLDDAWDPTQWLWGLYSTLTLPALTADAYYGPRYGDGHGDRDHWDAATQQIVCGFNPAIRTSWGFGFRWFSPLGPLRFEWGVPINRRPWESKIDFQFNIGNSF